MSFSLTILLPDEHESNPAFIRVAGLSVLTRLILGAAGVGANQVIVTGRHADLAKIRFGNDSRFKDIDIRWQEEMLQTDMVVEANVVVGGPVWTSLADSRDSVAVPGAPVMKRLGTGTEKPLWKDDAPVGCYVVPITKRSDARIAKRAIFSNVTKPTSGPVSRHINSILSIPVSKILCEFGVSPNTMTIVNVLVGLASAWFFSIGTLATVAIGGVLFQLCAALDRVDGELARSTFTATRRGAWLDTIGDNAVYIAFVIGLTVGYHRYAVAQGLAFTDWILPLGLTAAALVALLLGRMALYLVRNKRPGSMATINAELEHKGKDNESGWLFATLNRIKVIGKRDSFSFGVFLLALSPIVTGHPAGYHFMFWAIIASICLMNIHYELGVTRTRRSVTSAS